jgi:hypothetical protein
MLNNFRARSKASPMSLVRVGPKAASSKVGKTGMAHSIYVQTGSATGLSAGFSLPLRIRPPKAPARRIPSV